MIRITRSDLRRIVVAIDPATTSGEDSDETGIIVVGRGPHQPDTCQFTRTTLRCPGHGYILGDYTCKLPPSGWAKQALRAFDDWEADLIVAEVNNGGDMVGETVHAQRLGVPYRPVRASRGKLTRAEPVAALYDQGRMHHVGEFPELEDQMTTWAGEGDSPDRMDALVWGATALQLVGAQGAAFLAAWQEQIAASADLHPASSRSSRSSRSPATASSSTADPADDTPRSPATLIPFGRKSRSLTAPPIHFDGYEPVPYQINCRPGQRHRFFGHPATCVHCGCDAPVAAVT